MVDEDGFVQVPKLLVETASNAAIDDTIKIKMRDSHWTVKIDECVGILSSCNCSVHDNVVSRDSTVNGQRWRLDQDIQEEELGERDYRVGDTDTKKEITKANLEGEEREASITGESEKDIRINVIHEVSEDDSCLVHSWSHRAPRDSHNAGTIIKINQDDHSNNWNTKGFT